MIVHSDASSSGLGSIYKDNEDYKLSNRLWRLVHNIRISGDRQSNME